MARPTVGAVGTSSRRRPRPDSSTAKATGVVAVDTQHERGSRGRAGPLGEHVAQRLREVVDHVHGGRRVEAAGSVDGSSDVLLVHPDVERTVAQQGLPVPADAAEDGGGLGPAVGRRVREQARVPRRGRPPDLLDQLGRGPVLARHHALLGVHADQRGGRVRRVRGRCLLGLAGEDRLEVSGVRRARVDVPAGQVRGPPPVVVGEVVEEIGEAADRAPPDVDVPAQPLTIVHGWSLRPAA